MSKGKDNGKANDKKGSKGEKTNPTQEKKEKIASPKRKTFEVREDRNGIIYWQTLWDLIQNPTHIVLHYERDPVQKEFNGNEAIRCSGLKSLKRLGLERNEFPYKCTKEGGCGSTVWYASTNKNRKQGNLLRAFVQGMQDGEAFEIKLVPKQRQPQESPVPIFTPSLKNIRKWVKNKKFDKVYLHPELIPAIMKMMERMMNKSMKMPIFKMPVSLPVLLDGLEPWNLDNPRKYQQQQISKYYKKILNLYINELALNLYYNKNE